MALSNGQGTDMTSPPSETATFRIGGRDHKVGALTLGDLEELRELIKSMGPDQYWTEYASNVIRVVCFKLNRANHEEMARSMIASCSVPEARGLTASFNRLLFVSGFEVPDPDAPQGEDSATEESRGTGTLTESPQNSPSPSENLTPDALSAS